MQLQQMSLEQILIAFDNCKLENISLGQFSFQINVIKLNVGLPSNPLTLFLVNKSDDILFDRSSISLS
jgi:hypothetical protein